MEEEVKKNYSAEQVEEIIGEFPWVPLSNRIVITLNLVEQEEGEFVASDEALAEEQYVIAVGDMSKRFLTEGNVVLLDLDKMTVKERVDHDQTQLTSRIKIDPLVTDMGTFAIIYDNQIKAVKND